MKNGSARREGLARTVGTMRGIIDHVTGLESVAVYSKLDPVMRERLSGPRFRARIAMRHARLIAPRALFAPARDPREEMLIADGPAMIEALSIEVGTLALWEEVVRLVHRTDRELLDSELGVAAREIALRARELNFGIVPVSDPGGDIPLAERIRIEGATCWASWLVSCDVNVARRLRILTPVSVSERIFPRLPDSASDRQQRRTAVELVIDRFLKQRTAELGEGGAEND